jgi:hypothetical protein
VTGAAFGDDCWIGDGNAKREEEQGGPHESLF